MKYRPGYSVIEVLLAGSILALAIAGIVSAIVLAQRNNQASTAQSQALEMAQEGIEALRSIRNRDYALLVNTSIPAALQLSAGQWTINTTPNSNDDQLSSPQRTRRITIANDSTNPDTAKFVTVTVTYQINPEGDQKTIVLSETLSNIFATIPGGVTGVTATSNNFRLLNDAVGENANVFKQP